MKLYDGGKIFTGLVIALLAIAWPIWANLASGDQSKAPPELARARAGTECVLPTAEMRARHMDVLNDWRDLVVRQGQRTIELKDGEHPISLTKTCLGCHGDATKFCDSCHEYEAVSPTCWGCHVTPKGAR